jgi:hypothetical protein
MKHTVVISAIVAASFAPDYILATPVGNVIPRSPRPVTVKVQRRAKPKEEDVKLKAWIDRGQDVQVSLCNQTRVLPGLRILTTSCS